MIKEFDSVLLNIDLPEDGLFVGDVGVVVDILAGGEAYYVEFMTYSGKTIAVRMLEANEVRAMKGDPMLRVRELAEAA